MKDLNCAIGVTDEAVTAAPFDHPSRASGLSILGSHLGRRFKRTGVIEDLNRVVDVSDKAITATPLNHPGRADRLNDPGPGLARDLSGLGQQRILTARLMLLIRL